MTFILSLALWSAWILARLAIAAPRTYWAVWLELAWMCAPALVGCWAFGMWWTLS